MTIQQIREDFDRIALLPEHAGAANDHYLNYLLRHLPSRCENALEIGCGVGRFTRLLASRARRVVAIDLSPQMIRLARQQTARLSNIEYVQGDVMDLPLPAASYDCIVSIATLHHLPLTEALDKMKRVLQPGGALVIHDLIANDGLIDVAMSALAYPVKLVLRLWETGRFRTDHETEEAWTEHRKRDVYLKRTELNECARTVWLERMRGVTCCGDTVWFGTNLQISL